MFPFPFSIEPVLAQVFLFLIVLLVVALTVIFGLVLVVQWKGRKEQTELVKIVEEAEATRGRRSRVGFFLFILGAGILVWVGELIWHDVTVWSKDFALILFGSRTGENIGLGIGMRVIYYLMVGSGLLVSGLAMFLRRRQTQVVTENDKIVVLPVFPKKIKVNEGVFEPSREAKRLLKRIGKELGEGRR